MREPAFHPTVKALVTLPRTDGQCLDFAHAKTPLMMRTPAMSAAMDRPTDRPT